MPSFLDAKNLTAGNSPSDGPAKEVAQPAGSNCYASIRPKTERYSMDMTVEEMIIRLQRAVETERSEMEKYQVRIRRDFETEVTRINNRWASLGSAIAILADETTRMNAPSTLSPGICKQIMDVLDAKW